MCFMDCCLRLLRFRGLGLRHLGFRRLGLRLQGISLGLNGEPHGKEAEKDLKIKRASGLCRDYIDILGEPR